MNEKDFKFNIVDEVKVGKEGIALYSPMDPSKEYKDHLRVVFRFYDGNRVYVVEAEDGIGLILLEHEAELVKKAVGKQKQSRRHR